MLNVLKINFHARIIRISIFAITIKLIFICLMYILFKKLEHSRLIAGIHSYLLSHESTSSFSSLRRLSGSPFIRLQVVSSLSFKSPSMTIGSFPDVCIFQYKVSVIWQFPHVRGPSSPKKPIFGG